MSSVVYDSRRQVDISYTKKWDAPERGSVFTAKAISQEDKSDLILKEHSNYTGYIKTNPNKFIKVVPESYYRFRVVAGPFTKDLHNFYYVIPLRRVENNETLDRNQISPSDSLLIQRLAEFLLEIGFNRESRKHYPLHKSQRNWDWFHRNFRENMASEVYRKR